MEENLMQEGAAAENPAAEQHRRNIEKMQSVREYTFIILYELLIRHEVWPDSMMFALTEEMVGKPMTDEVRGQVTSVLHGQEEYDRIISEYSTKRVLNRIPLVNRAILWVALFELRTKKKSMKTNEIVSEAVRIAQKYASEEDVAFVNGLLGKYVRNQGK